jgi:site-specific recombinase XerD
VKCSLYEGTKHSLGTALKAKGVEDRVIQQLFGHADIRSVQAYARIEDATQREAMARLHPSSADE